MFAPSTRPSTTGGPSVRSCNVCAEPSGSTYGMPGRTDSRTDGTQEVAASKASHQTRPAGTGPIRAEARQPNCSRRPLIEPPRLGSELTRAVAAKARIRQFLNFGALTHD